MAKDIIECPICLGEFHAIDKAGKVCKTHERGWIITTCPDCHVTRFSQTKGVCSDCLEKSPKVTGFGFNKNHRSGLWRNGMGCKENG